MAVSLEDFGRQLDDGPFWITGAFFKEFIEVLVADRARPGANMDELPTPKGRFLNAKAGGGAAASTPNPFDCTIANGQASFVPGAGQGLVPGNMSAPLAVPASVSYVVLRLNTDGQSVQNCTLMITSTAPVSPAPTKASLPQQVDVLLHLIGYTPGSNGAAGTYTAVRYFYPATNVSLTPIEAFQTSVNDPQPGGPAYDHWYTWQIGGT